MPCLLEKKAKGMVEYIVKKEFVLWKPSKLIKFWYTFWAWKKYNTPLKPFYFDPVKEVYFDVTQVDRILFSWRFTSSAENIFPVNKYFLVFPQITIFNYCLDVFEVLLMTLPVPWHCDWARRLLEPCFERQPRNTVRVSKHVLPWSRYISATTLQECAWLTLLHLKTPL